MEARDGGLTDDLAERGRINEVGRKMNAALDYMGDFLKCACAGRRISRPLLGGYTAQDLESMAGIMHELGNYLDGCGVMDEDDEDQAVVNAGFDAYRDHLVRLSPAPLAGPEGGAS